MQDRLSFTEYSLVSAVIPTRGRPELVVSAVHSALRQTWKLLEVVVVVDGPDAATEKALRSIADPRLRVVVLEESGGGAAARNAGVRAAHGEWIAFLDDDDAWLPRKIEWQMRAIQETTAWFPVISCRVIEQSPEASRVLPARVYDRRQPVGDYLFRRAGLGDAGGLMQTSTLLASRELLLAIPFREGLPMHQDWDWLIQVASHKGVEITMVPKPLTIWKVEDERGRVSRSTNWQFSLAWIRQIRSLVSRRAFSSFIAIQCVWRARAGGAGVWDRLRILSAFLWEGSPEWRSLVHFGVFSVFPGRVYGAMRRVLRMFPGRQEPEPGLRLAWTRKAAPAVLRKTSG